MQISQNYRGLLYRIVTPAGRPAAPDADSSDDDLAAELLAGIGAGVARLLCCTLLFACMMHLVEPRLILVLE